MPMIPRTMTSQSYWNPGIDFDSEAYISKQVFYESKDGTQGSDDYYP